MSKTLTQNEIMQKLKLNKSNLEKEFGIKKIALFGSVARGEHTNNSDIDILIDMEQKNYFKLLKIEEKLSSLFDKKIDLGFFRFFEQFY